MLIWLYLISLAVLVGAAFNASLDAAFPRLLGEPARGVSIIGQRFSDCENLI